MGGSTILEAKTRRNRVVPETFIRLNEFRGHTVLILGSALLLALVAIASFPCWPYSRRFGYGPSTSAGVLLVLAALLAVSHKPDIVVVAGPTTHIGPAAD